MATDTTILIVDDDEEILDLLHDYLGAEGYSVSVATTGQEALKQLSRARVDCLLLDVMLPGQSGFEICRRVREQWDLPILFVSARQDEVDRLRGLGLGADDFIVKTCSPAEVAARVKAVMRRYRRGMPESQLQISYGSLTLDLAAREVLVDGHPVPFTAKEFDLLKLFADHPRQVFTRELIASQLWDQFGDPRAVNGLVTRVRAKIEADPQNPVYIKTVWGVGYRFEGERRR